MNDQPRRARFLSWEIDEMMDREQRLPRGVPVAAAYTDYYEIEADGARYVVPLSTALAIEHRADACVTPDGLEFHDVFGARHRLPARCAYRIRESTKATRAAMRASAARTRG